MIPPQDDPAPLIVNGIAVGRKLLESRSIQRCSLHECQAHCCSGGVYLDVNHAKRIMANQETILPHVPEDRRNPETWFDWNLEPEIDHPTGGMQASTNVAKDSTHPAGQSCVFLRPDRMCALQVASLAIGKHPWHFKPYYCALFPLVFHRHQLVLDDDNEVYLEGGSCSRASCSAPVPLYRLFDLEMKLALGEAGYAELIAKVENPSMPPPA